MTWTLGLNYWVINGKACFGPLWSFTFSMLNIGCFERIFRVNHNIIYVYLQLRLIKFGFWFSVAVLFFFNCKKFHTYFASQIPIIRSEFRKVSFYLHRMTLILHFLLTRLKERINHLFMENQLTWIIYLSCSGNLQSSFLHASGCI